MPRCLIRISAWPNKAGTAASLKSDAPAPSISGSPASNVPLLLWGIVRHALCAPDRTQRPHTADGQGRGRGLARPCLIRGWVAVSRQPIAARTGEATHQPCQTPKAISATVSPDAAAPPRWPAPPGRSPARPPVRPNTPRVPPGQRAQPADSTPRSERQERSGTGAVQMVLALVDREHPARAARRARRQRAAGRCVRRPRAARRGTARTRACARGSPARR